MYEITVGGQCHGRSEHSGRKRFFKLMKTYLASVLAPKSDVGRIAHLDPMAIDKLVPANDADERLVNAYKFRGLV